MMKMMMKKDHTENLVLQLIIFSTATVVCVCVVWLENKKYKNTIQQLIFLVSTYLLIIHTVHLMGIRLINDLSLTAERYPHGSSMLYH